MKALILIQDELVNKSTLRDDHIMA